MPWVGSHPTSTQIMTVEPDGGILRRVDRQDQFCYLARWRGRYGTASILGQIFLVILESLCHMARDDQKWWLLDYYILGGNGW